MSHRSLNELTVYVEEGDMLIPHFYRRTTRRNERFSAANREVRRYLGRRRYTTQQNGVMVFERWSAHERRIRAGKCHRLRWYVSVPHAAGERQADFARPGRLFDEQVYFFVSLRDGFRMFRITTRELFNSCFSNFPSFRNLGNVHRG